MNTTPTSLASDFDILDYLACPLCCSPLTRNNESGDLNCSCGQSLRMSGKVYYTSTPPTSEEGRQTIEKFGKRWNMVYKQMGGLKNYLMPMIEPVREEFFRGKVVIDAGCGFGRLSKLLLDYGAKHVIMLDASEAVLAAAEYLKHYRDRITIVQSNLLFPPLARGMADIFFCHGVLHHTGDPQGVIQSISRAINSENGAMILWVYAEEGNSFMSRVVNLTRAVSLRLGDRGSWGLARLADTTLWLLTSAVYKPLVKVGLPPAWLWYGNYLLDFLYDPVINNTMDRLQMFHDFLTTCIIEYYSKPQLEAWCSEAGYRRTCFNFFRKQSWGVSASFCPAEDFSGTRPNQLPSSATAS